MKTYNLSQLQMVGLIACRKHWYDALTMAGFTSEEASLYALSLSKYKMCKFLVEYCPEGEELMKFDQALTLLINMYEL